jgi:hypothetical protein
MATLKNLFASGLYTGSKDYAPAEERSRGLSPAGGIPDRPIYLYPVLRTAVLSNGLESVVCFGVADDSIVIIPMSFFTRNIREDVNSAKRTQLVSVADGLSLKLEGSDTSVVRQFSQAGAILLPNGTVEGFQPTFVKEDGRFVPDWTSLRARTIREFKLRKIASDPTGWARGLRNLVDFLRREGIDANNPGIIDPNIFSVQGEETGIEGDSTSSKVETETLSQEVNERDNENGTPNMPF